MMMLPVCMLWMCTFATAAAPWPPTGELDWACAYDASALPNEVVPLWSGHTNAGTRAEVTPEGLLIVDSSTERGSLCSWRRSWRVDPAQGGVLEARVKVMACSAFGGVCLMMADGVHEVLVTLYPDRVDANDGELSAPFTTTDAFHVYRVAARGGDYLVWADGELVIDGTAKFTKPAHSNRSQVSFGAAASAAESEAVYSAVRYVPLGELPMPERYAKAEDVIIYKEPGVYACFPSLYVLEDGAYVTSFGTRVHRSHINPEGGSAAFMSKDKGRTWSRIEGPRPVDPSLRRNDGTYVRADAFGWRHVPESRRDDLEAKDITVRAVRDGVVAYLQGARVSRSEDGKTWETEALQLPRHRSLMTYHRVDYHSLSEGLRVVSIYGELPEDTKTRSFLLRSNDDGDTWWFLPLAADPEHKVKLNETALAENAEDELIAMIRAEPPEGGHLYTTFSKDKGITWAPARETAIWGYPAHLLRLSDGRMLCSYGYRRDPMGVRAVISDDGGHTWNPEDEVILRCDGGVSGSDLGYPISIETSPGKVFTIYYFTTDDGVTHIAGTHWPVPEQ